MKPCVNDYLCNIKKQVKEVSCDEVKSHLPDNALLIDVREPTEVAQGKVVGAVNIPRGVLEFKLFGHECVEGICDEDLFEKPIYLYCASGGRSACSAHALQQLGFKNVFSMAGGFKEWQNTKGAIEKP